MKNVTADSRQRPHHKTDILETEGIKIIFKPILQTGFLKLSMMEEIFI